MKTRKFLAFRFLPLLALASSGGIARCQGLGELMISPTHLSIDDKNHAGTIVVVNSGQKTVRYRLDLVDMQMSSDGQLQRLQTSNSAAPYIRLSPREITLAPGGSQKVRILSTTPGDSPAGEYRSHLEFIPIRRNTGMTPSQPGSALKINLDVSIVVTIPLFLHTGRVYSAASLSDASFKVSAAGSSVRFKLGREGNESLRGDLNISFKPAKGGSVALAQMKGLAVYYPNSSRTVQLALPKDLSALGEGEIEIKFAKEGDRRAEALRLAVGSRH